MPFVYVLSNRAMPGLVKIGRTDTEDVSARIAQLYSTGVPFPFEIEFACRVPNPSEVEEALHRAFAPNRINQKREFFQIEPDQPIAILRLLHVEDATKAVAAEPTTVEAAEVEAAEQYQVKTRRPNFNFEEMGIATGAKLVLNRTGQTVTVAGPKKVLLDSGEEMYLSAATRFLLNADHPVAPIAYWSYQGRPLAEIYNQTYMEEA